MFNIKVEINMSELATRLRQITGSERNQYCHQCGKCTSGCLAADFFDFSPRKIVAMVQLGMIEELLASEIIWHCAQCLLCKERCPRDVSPSDIIQALQNLAYSSHAPVPEGYPALITSILKTGMVQTPMKVRVWKELPTRDLPRRAFEFRDRLSLGLPQLKKPDKIQNLARALQEALKWKEK
jgi:heterodisulfide reductase subunit C